MIRENMKNKLKYLGYTVVFQEVPNEVSLAINISGCPHHCEGCHSQYLWEYKGEYLLNDLNTLLEQYSDFVTCVCFMGGDQNLEELVKALKIVKSYGLKTCIYSGSDVDVFLEYYDLIDYLKLGSYRDKYGGLNSKNTNQRMYKIINGIPKDITKTFWKEEKR